MSPLLKRKQEHERLCDEATRAGNFRQASKHAAQAADCALILAKDVEPSLAEGYVSDAEEWLDMADKLKQRIPGEKQNNARPVKDKSASSEDSEDWQVSDIPDISFDDIAGMQTAKDAIRQMVIHPLSRPDIARSLGLNPGGGVLLYGPPGNGKTLLGKAIAHDLNCAFFYASGAQIRSKWHGESEQRLSRLLQAAKKSSPSVLFLDEIDGLLPRRSSHSVVDNRIVTQFISEIGGFENQDQALLILGATNCPWDIDDAVFRTGRFDQKIYIPPPDSLSRKTILDINLRDTPFGPDIATDNWAERLEGYSGSDISGLVLAAKRIALARAVQSDTPAQLTNDDIEQALPTIHHSITPKMLARFKSFSSK